MFTLTLYKPRHAAHSTDIAMSGCLSNKREVERKYSERDHGEAFRITHWK
jgi:hypothetical protein